MTKEDLVHITLNQLCESLVSSPQNFRLEDPEVGQTSASFPGPTLIWQFKVETKPGTYINDPLNATRTIIVSYNKIARQLTCLIYFREVNNMNTAMMADSQAVIKYSEWCPLVFNRTYRQFAHIRESILKQKREQEYVDYLKKLHNIFPSAQDEELFK